MKKILLAIALFAFTFQVNGQNIEWANLIGSSVRPVVDAKGNVYTIQTQSAGATQRINLAYVSYKTWSQSGDGYEDYVISKFSPQGQHLWTRAVTLHTTSNALNTRELFIYADNEDIYFANSLYFHHVDDTVRITSTHTDGVTDTTYTTITNEVTEHTALVSLNKDGYIKWATVVKGRATKAQNGKCITSTDDKIILVTKYPVTKQFNFSRNGVLLNSYQDFLGNFSEDHFGIVALKNSSSYLISANEDLHEGLETLYKYNGSDTEVKTFTMSDYDANFSGFSTDCQMFVDSSNNIYVYGRVNGTGDFMGVDFTGGKQMLLKLDSNLNPQWARAIYSKVNNSIDVPSKSSIVIAGDRIYISNEYNVIQTEYYFGANKTGNGKKTFVTVITTNGDFVTNLSFPDEFYGEIDLAYNKYDTKHLYAYVAVKDSLFAGGLMRKFIGMGEMALVKFKSEHARLKGITYFDINKNSIKDVNEFNFPYRIIKSDSTFAVSQKDGSYFKLLDTGSHTIVPVPYRYFNVVPDTQTIHTSIYDTTITIDFAYQPVANINDLEVYLTNVSPARPGFNVVYRLTAKNVGTTVLNSTVKLTYDSLFTFQNAAPLQNTHNYPELTWNLTNLKPGDEKNFTIRFTLASPPNATFGDTLCSFAEINPLTNDTTENNNKDTLYQFVRGSYDPNIKETNKPEIIDIEKVNGSFPIDYTIHFQNTGNDTAFHVYLIDTLDADLKIVSIEILSASHDYEFSISENNTLRWDYYNILLVDSNTNEPESHGFIKYRVWTKDNPGIGDEFTNTAHIYFDFNEPIVTNTTKNTIDEIESVELVAGKTVTVYPNPTSGNINITIDLEAGVKANVKVTDLTGKQVYAETTTTDADGLNQSINLTDLPQGIYFVQVYANNKVYTAKVVKQ